VLANFWDLFSWLFREKWGTTQGLDDHLVREAKKLAARTHHTLGEVVEEGLRILLARKRARRPEEKSPLVTFEGGGLRPGIDLDDSASLLGVMATPHSPSSISS
jgi:hypothetical protein